MVKVHEFINNSRMPQKVKTTEFLCDSCGCSCIQSGARSERLYSYNDDELCFECLWDALITDGTIEIVG